jgi:hypothetical protein
MLLPKVIVKWCRLFVELSKSRSPPASRPVKAGSSISMILLSVKRILRKYGYPPDKQESAGPPSWFSA